MTGAPDAAALRPKGRSLADFPNLGAAERILLRRCATGEAAHFGDARPDAASDANRISPNFVRFLALGGDAFAPVHEKGVQVEGAWIDGTIDFEGCTLPQRLRLQSCHVDGALRLRDAQLVSLNLENTSVRGIIANRLRCSGTVLLWRKFHSCGGVQLMGARIDGNFDCEGALLEDDDVALDCDGAQFDGRVFLNKGFEAIGEVRFRVASLARELDCRGGRFDHCSGIALNCTRMDVAGSAFLGEGFHATGEVQLVGAKIGGDFSCEGGRFEHEGKTALNCDGATISNRVFLRNEYDEGGLQSEFCAVGQVRFVGATIGGDLDCDGGSFEQKDGIALNCDGAKIGSRLLLRDGFRSVGAVQFARAKISDVVGCERGHFENAPGVALDCAGAEIGGGAYLRHEFKATGAVQFIAAKIGGDLDCDGGSFEQKGGSFEQKDGSFEQKDGIALNCDGAKIGGRVLLRAVQFARAKIDDDIGCGRGQFENAPGIALDCSGAKFGGGAKLRYEFKATGAVQFIAAKIGGDLNCEGGRFEHPGSIALNCDRAIIGGRVFLCNLVRGNDTIRFHATGEVRFLAAKLSGLNCSGGLFERGPAAAQPAHDPAAAREESSPDVLSCDAADIDGNVRLKDGFHATGAVRLVGAQISGELSCINGRFDNNGGYALLCQRAEIKGALFFKGVTRVAGTVSLNGTHVAVLADDADSWTAGVVLNLDGFTYDRIGAGSPVAANDRILWLDRQERDDLGRHFKPQPWNQLAHVLYAMGYEDDAKTVRIEMRTRWRQSHWQHRATVWQRRWARLNTGFDWLLGSLVGYGYRPWRILRGFASVYVIGALVFAFAPTGVMVPTDAKSFLAKGVPAQCAVDWITFAGPPLPPSAQAADPAKQARLLRLVNEDARQRASAAAKFGVSHGGSATWPQICERAMLPEFVKFDPLLYSLELLMPVLDLRQKARWTPRALGDNGALVAYGAGVFVQTWQFFEVLAVLFFSLLLVASVSGIIKKE